MRRQFPVSTPRDDFLFSKAKKPDVPRTPSAMCENLLDKRSGLNSSNASSTKE
jgi:hypothetical protein